MVSVVRRFYFDFEYVYSKAIKDFLGLGNSDPITEVVSLTRGLLSWVLLYIL